MKTRSASCSCGQLRALVRGEPEAVTVCHCLACHRRTGSVMGVQARFRRDAVEISGASKAWSRVGDGGTRITFTFCPDCGATIGYVLAGREDFIVIPVGAFADPQFPAPEVSVYEEQMHTWLKMPPDMEHLA